MTHEFFHLFLVKRIKPESFFSYDYENETYTSHLWIMEGVTSYYDQYLLLRSKLVTPDIIFGMFAENIKQLEQIPGRFVQSIEESSFDAWVKFYRSDENTSNTTISYYLKGSLVTFSLDIFIRIKSGNLYTFEDVLRYLYTTYAKNSKGYPEKGDNFIDIIKTVTQVDVRTFYDDYIVGRKDPEFVEILNHLGLDLKREYDKKFGFDEKSVGYLGIETEIKENRLFIKKILADSPAYNFGLNFNDEIIAINDYRVLSDNFEERIANFKPETIIKFLISRKGQMKNINVTLGMSKASKYTITFVKNPTDTQKAFYKSWSSQEFPNSEKINS